MKISRSVLARASLLAIAAYVLVIVLLKGRIS
jgi:hypothetical protein